MLYRYCNEIKPKLYTYYINLLQYEYCANITSIQDAYYINAKLIQYDNRIKVPH